MENLLDKIEKRPIPKTKYEIDQNGFIYRRARQSSYERGAKANPRIATSES